MSTPPNLHDDYNASLHTENDDPSFYNPEPTYDRLNAVRGILFALLICGVAYALIWAVFF